MSKPQFLLQHLRFGRITAFSFPQRLQDQLAREFLDHKALVSSSTPPSPLSTPPIPKVISFTPLPVYTTGRREHGTLSENQLGLLKAPLPFRKTPSKPYATPEVWPTKRGGQTTFHGPGQVVMYPILDLKANYPLWPKGLSPWCYVNLLEETTIRTLSQWGLKSIRTENPGVWADDGERKIAALGVHLRRNITSYGVGLNVYTDLRYFDRIVACGLVGKKVTNMRELAKEKGVWEVDIWNGTREKRDAAVAARYAAMEEGEKSPDQDDNTAESASVQDISKKRRADTIHLSHNLLNSVGKAWYQEFMKGLYGEYLPDQVDHSDGWKECKNRGID